MHLRQSKALFSTTGMMVFAVLAGGQTQDNSQNGLLKGNYVFRHVAVQNVDANFDPSQVTASSGTIVFDGAGNYTITGTSVDRCPACKMAAITKMPIRGTPSRRNP